MPDACLPRPICRPAAGQPNAEALAVTRQTLRDMLTRSQAFQQLPRDRQVKLANELVQIGTYLAAPEGMQLPQAQHAPIVRQLAGETVRQRGQNVNEDGKFTAQAASEGARVAGALLQAVNFPTFVASLIQGVFHAIVTSSIEQMEAYGRLVADVAKTLNQFRDENVSVDQGRDHLVDQFPDVFKVDIDTGDFGGSAGPRVRLQDGVDEEEALRRVNSTLPVEGGALDSLDDDSIEEKLVPAARMRLATSRQQLLATMVLMGINRIVVTDGKIMAKVMYDFQSRDTMRFQKSATQFDYAKDQYGNLQTTRAGEGQSEVEQDRGGYTYGRDKEGKTDIDYRGGSYYAKGEYKYQDQPVVTLMSASQLQTDAALQAKASLAGHVEVNFKSDYLPLEKMADSFQIAQIQNAAKPAQTRAAAAPAAQTPAQPPANQGATPTPAQR